MPKIFRAIGAMTGTSMDAIDLAYLETDGRQTLKFGPSASYPFSDADRALLRQAVAAAKYLGRSDERPGPLAEAEDLITRRHVEAIGTFLGDNGIDAAAVDLIGFHGQTVLHRPEHGLTVQIGDGALLARQIGIDVAYDLIGFARIMLIQESPLFHNDHWKIKRIGQIAGTLDSADIG